MSPELGVVEGYFGTPWSPADRKHVIAVLAGLGYAFFHFAPKADVFLRRRWREPHPCSALADLADLSRDEVRRQRRDKFLAIGRSL